MGSLFTSRNVLIMSTLLVVASPRLYQTFLKILPVIQHSGIPVPEWNGSQFIVPGMPAIDEKSLGAKIRLAVCASDQFRAAAEETKRVLEHNFPHAEVSAEHYMPPEGRVLATQLLAALQGFLIMTSVIGSGVLKSFGMDPVPAVVDWITRHRLVCIGLTWIAGNYLTSMLLTTGGFEIYANGRLLFSRLAEGELPHMKTLIEGLQYALNDDSIG